MLEFFSAYLTDDALTADPYLSGIDSEWHDAIQAGHYLQTSYLLKNKRHENAATARTTYQSLLRRAATALQ